MLNTCDITFDAVTSWQYVTIQQQIQHNKGVAAVLHDLCIKRATVLNHDSPAIFLLHHVQGLKTEFCSFRAKLTHLQLPLLHKN